MCDKEGCDGSVVLEYDALSGEELDSFLRGLIEDCQTLAKEELEFIIRETLPELGSVWWWII